MRLALALLAAAAAVSFVPQALAADASATLAFGPGFTSASLHAEIPIAGTDAADIRQAMDSPYLRGNGDGQVSQSEADAFLDTARPTMEKGAVKDFDSGNTTFDGHPLGVPDFGGFAMQGAVGPVDSTDAITVQVDATLHLEPGPGPDHTFFSPADQGTSTSSSSAPPPSPDDAMQVHVKAPSGFVISRADGFPGHTLSDDGATLTFPAAGSSGDTTIVFSPTGSAGGAGSKPDAILRLGDSLGLAAVAALARRHA